MLVSSTGSLTISLSIEIGFFISVVPLSTCRSCDATLIRTAQADSLARAGQHSRREPNSLFPDRVETERRTIPPGEASDGVPGLRHSHEDQEQYRAFYWRRKADGPESRLDLIPLEFLESSVAVKYGPYKSKRGQKDFFLDAWNHAFGHLENF